MAKLDEDPQEALRRLHSGLNRDTRHLMRMDAYYEGMQPLRFINPAQMAELGSRLTPLVINWPALAVRSYEPRLNLEGFRLPGEVDADETLWQVWQDNRMRLGSKQVHAEAIALGRSYVALGVTADDETEPLITPEHPLECYTIDDPRTKEVAVGLKRWKDEENASWSTLYGPNDTRYFRRGRGGWVEDVSMKIDHGWGVVPLVPMVLQQRLIRNGGKSIFHEILPLADAVNKICTDMMVSAEYHAMPRRWAFGLTAKDFVDEQGRQLSTWEQIAGRLWATASHPDNVKVGQFPEAELSNFHNTVKLLAQLCSQLLALPPNYMSFVGENPTSADAIRAGETQLVMGAEGMQVGFGDSWVRVGCISLKIKGSDDDLLKAAKRMEPVWRDAATPTKAQLFDAVTKAVSVKILPIEGAWDELGYSKQRKARLIEQFERQQRFELEGIFPTKDPAPEPDPEPAPA